MVLVRITYKRDLSGPRFFYCVRWEELAKKRIRRGDIAELAELLSITERRVYQLIDEKVIKKERSGDIKLPNAIEAYYDNKYKVENNGGINYSEEKAKRERANRQLTELELAKKRNEVHDAADVELVMTNMLTNLRTQLLGMPSKLAPVIANKDKNYINKILTEEIEQSLSELSDYSPDMFEEGEDDRSTND